MNASEIKTALRGRIETEERLIGYMMPLENNAFRRGIVVCAREEIEWLNRLLNEMEENT